MIRRGKEFIRDVQEGFIQEQQRYHEDSEADIERVKKLIGESMEKLQSSIEEGQNRVRSDIESAKAVVKERLDDISQFFDRYM